MNLRVRQKKFFMISALIISQMLMSLVCLAADHEKYFKQGTLYLEQGRPGLAVKAFTQAIREKPSYVEAYNNRALAFYEMGKREKATSDLLYALGLEPNNEITNTNLGVLFVEQRDYQNALIYLERAVRVVDSNSPYFLVILRNIAFVYEKVGIQDQAMRQKRECIVTEETARPPATLSRRRVRGGSTQLDHFLNLTIWKSGGRQ